MIKAFFLAAAAALMATPVSGWWCDGHMLTAAIAFNNIQESTRTVFQPLINYLDDLYPNTGTSFVESACWADDIKEMGVEQYSNLHFIDLPVMQPPIFFDIPAISNSSNNPWAIKQAVKTLTSHKSTILDRAVWLRLLIHLAGDIHQPLHAASLYSSMFPQGDMGGNLYPIAGTPITDLHGFWDSGGLQWSTDLVRPLNATGVAWLDNWMNTITTNYPPSSFANALTLTDPWDWAIESNGLAWSFVYTAPMAPSPITNQYLTQTQAMTQQRVALGGYRLGALLDSIASQVPPNTTISTNNNNLDSDNSNKNHRNNDRIISHQKNHLSKRNSDDYARERSLLESESRRRLRSLQNEQVNY